MTRDRSDSDRAYRRQSGESELRRRTVLAAGGTAGAALIAGCTGGDGSGDPAGDGADGGTTTDDDGGSGGTTGTFRLLVTDLPADIGDFDSLKVTLDRARVFRDDAEGGDEVGDETDGSDGEANESDGDAAANQSDGDADAKDAEESDGGEEKDGEESGEKDDGEGDREFFWLDLEGATVDLTQVIGDKAVSVFEGELEAGTYSKVELHAADIEGIVDGEPVDVKIPSGKLQIVHGFEVHPDEPVEFVFDIHVVKKGNGGYNLRPVISGSGVNGKDVEVEEVDPDEEGGDGEEKDGEESGDETSGGADGGSAGDGNESA